MSKTNYTVKPVLGYSSLSTLSRQDAVVLRRLRIGHTRLTHSYLLNRQDQHECSHYDCALTVAHVLLECNHYNMVRQRYFSISSLHELFDTVNAQNILGFIRDIGLYRLGPQFSAANFSKFCGPVCQIPWITAANLPHIVINFLWPLNPTKYAV